MSLEIKINNDIKAAMLARDAPRLEALRAVKAALLLEKTKEGGTAAGPTEPDEIKMLQKLVKQRRESAQIYRDAGRNDLASAEEFQAGIILHYLPAQLDETAIRNLLSEIIVQTCASGIKDMGKVMGEASKKLAGKADNKLVAALVRELLGIK